VSGCRTINFHPSPISAASFSQGVIASSSAFPLRSSLDASTCFRCRAVLCAMKAPARRNRSLDEHVATMHGLLYFLYFCRSELTVSVRKQKNDATLGLLFLGGHFAIPHHPKISLPPSVSG
jgi:hypothetical protein